MLDKVWKNIENVRTDSPLVHNITNLVVMNSTANALLAMGASPIMASDTGELSEIVALSNSLVLNIGTISSDVERSMYMAAEIAVTKGLPIVLDPVGAGASRLRTKVSRKIIRLAGKNFIIRGNASEIMALVEDGVKTRGVDSSSSVEESFESAKKLAYDHKCVVVVSGEKDFITNGEESLLVHGGNKLMTKVTGMGCTSTCAVAACAAKNTNLMEAATAGMALMATAGSLAGERTSAPGSFQVAFLDALCWLTIEHLYRYVKIESV